MARNQYEFDVIGVLPSDDFMYNRYENKEVVFINRQNSAQFCIRPISETPSIFPNGLVTGYPSDIEIHGYEDTTWENEIRRIDDTKNFFNDYLVIFNPLKKGENYYLANVRLVPKPNNYLENTTYIPLPVFSHETHKLSFEEFMEHLTMNRFVGKIKGISTDINETPSIVLWKENEGEYKVIGEFEKHRYAHGGFQFSYKNLKCIEFDENWLYDAVIDEKASKELIFVGNETFDSIIKGIDAAEDYQFEKAQSTGNNIEKPQTDVPKLPSLASPIMNPDLHTEVDQKIEENTETVFIETLNNLARESGLVYDPKDLINFHTAMKASTLVILAGMSGTGKSQLVQLYGKALGIEQQVIMIPVRPAWTDDADLIGYVDSIHMVYRPGDCGLVNTMIKASQEKESLFIVCFDEMNLARVEHYFSQFLSVLEMEGHRRQLRLYNDGVQQRLYNGQDYPPTIPIGDNVLFVGTVNIDESTYHFSNKVLDRANVIKLNVLDFQELKGMNLDKRRTLKKTPEVTYTQYAVFKNEEVILDLKDREIEFFTELNTIFREASKDIGFGPRVVRQIAKYIANLPSNNYLNRQQAIDIQIVQRILTKLKGPEDQLKHLLGSFNSRTKQLEKGILFNLLEKYTDISQFEQTESLIILKAKELKMFGYTV